MILPRYNTAAVLTMQLTHRHCHSCSDYTVHQMRELTVAALFRSSAPLCAATR